MFWFIGSFRSAFLVPMEIVIRAKYKIRNTFLEPKLRIFNSKLIKEVSVQPFNLTNSPNVAIFCPLRVLNDHQA